MLDILDVSYDPTMDCDRKYDSIYSKTKNNRIIIFL